MIINFFETIMLLFFMYFETVTGGLGNQVTAINAYYCSTIVILNVSSGYRIVFPKIVPSNQLIRQVAIQTQV